MREIVRAENCRAPIRALAFQLPSLDVRANLQGVDARPSMAVQMTARRGRCRI